MMNHRFWQAVALAWVAPSLVSGCSENYLQDEVVIVSKNQCENSSSCGAGFCSQGICQARQSQLPALLLEVVPPSGTPFIAGLNFTTTVEELDPVTHNIELELVSRITGSVFTEAQSQASCVEDRNAGALIASDNGSLPARITLTPRERILGLPSPPHSTEVKSLGDKREYNWALNVPPGNYDIYVEPATADSGGCALPPYLIVNQQFEGKDLKLTLELPAPEPLGVTIRYPQVSGDLSKWKVDIVERDTGRLLSNQPELGEPTLVGEQLEYSVRLAFSSVTGDEGMAAAELVRLSPPEDLVAPTIYVERSVVDLFQEGQGLIDQLTELAEPVEFSSRVTISGSPKASPSTVTLIAVELESTAPGTVAAFSRRVETDDEGKFTVELLPGRYRMLADPLDPSLALTEVELIVSKSEASESQIGVTIEVAPRPMISGRVMGFTGQGVVGASMWARATMSSSASTVIDQALGRVVPAPSSQDSSSQSGGQFSLLTDSGVFNISARPEANSGFAWGVVLGVEVGTDDINLGRLALPLPVVVRGNLTSRDVGDLVPDALIRAYAFLKDGEPAKTPDEADAVIAVAESRVDSEGGYQLLLPSLF